MARTLTFDARFANDSGVGQAMDSSIYADIFEYGNPTYEVRRTLGTDPAVNLFQSSDASGVFYTTTVDVSSFAPGDVTIKWYATKNGTPPTIYPYVETLPYPFLASLDLAEIRNYIRSMLGFPAVAVELTGDHYRVIIEEALATYNQYLPVEKRLTVDLVAGQSAYYLGDMPTRGPAHVYFVRKDGVPGIVNPFFGSEFPWIQNVQLDTYMMGISYLEMAERIVSSEPDWIWSASDKKLWLTTGASGTPQTGHYVQVLYYDEVGIDGVKSNHFKWFRSYCLAIAKRILAQIRGKYQGDVASPSGKITMNWEQLEKAAVLEEEKLKEEARLMSPPVPPVQG